MKILRNILAIILGIIVGSLVNMLIVVLSYDILPYPEGVIAMNMDDMFNMEAMQNTIESIKANIDKFTFSHYIFPFLAHAIGSFAGAWLAAKIAGTRKMLFAIIVGAYFLLGGILNATDLGMPFLATAIDLVFAYIPFAYLGGKLGSGRK